jgi:zinc transport system permease protein
MVETVPVTVIYLMLMGMVALTVVMLMRVVGLILVIAMLTVPAAISGQFVRDMRKMMLLASGLGVVFTTVGLLLSYFLNLTSGATIILFSGAAYLASTGLQPLIQRRRASTGQGKG